MSECNSLRKVAREWLQQGVINWNKGNIELENKSTEEEAASSRVVFEGGSFNIIFLDEFAFYALKCNKDVFLVQFILQYHQVKIQR